MLVRHRYTFTVSLPCQFGIGIPALTSVRYRWSRIIPVVPSYVDYLLDFRSIEFDCEFQLCSEMTVLGFGAKSAYYVVQLVKKNKWG
jgi:hypothetical protein